MTNPILSEAREYPFARLLAVKARREAEGRRVLDFGMGDPRDPTPAFLRETLARSVPETSSYPTVRGRRDLREAIVDHLRRRFGLELDPDRHVLPLNGTKEGIFTSHLALLDPASARRTVVTFEPAYPVYADGARYAGGALHPVVLRREDRFRARPESLAPELLGRTAMVWLNHPHNPTGAEAAAADLAHFVALARQHDFVLCSDECYADLYFGDAPPSALRPEDGPDFPNVLAFHSCSKRSCMTGYRSGFVAGDPRLISLLAKFRPSVGVATPDFVQAAAAAAWRDQDHVREIVARYGRRRARFQELLAKKGWHHDGGDATFYLWVRVPAGYRDSVAFAEALLEHDVLVTPGSYLGEGGEQHVRFALVASEEDCDEAVRRLEEMGP